MKTLAVLSVLYFSAGAFGFDPFNFNVRGYDEQGNKVRCEGLKEGESCESTQSEFTDKCTAQGHHLLYCSDCTTLCSEPVN